MHDKTCKGVIATFLVYVEDVMVDQLNKSVEIQPAINQPGTIVSSDYQWPLFIFNRW